MPLSFEDNSLLRFLEEKTPEAALYAGLGGKPSRGLQKFTRGYAPLLLNRYLGEQTSNLIEGEPSDELFTSWWHRNFASPWAGQGLSAQQAGGKALGREYRRFSERGSRAPMRFLW